MKDITHFIQTELYPTLWHSIDRVFPQMAFTLRRNKWESPRNIDGSTPKNPRKDKSVITSQLPTRILEHGEGGSKDLISLYKDLNSLATDMEATKAISGLLGLELPEGDSETWKRYREQQDRLHSAKERMSRALFSPEGKEVLDYLRDVRGYSDAVIEAMGLGYCSEAEAVTLGLAETPVGKYFVLAVPYQSGGTLYGFKFRYVSAEAREKYGNRKYYNSPDLRDKMNLHPFGLPGVAMVGDQKGIVVVESELDTLHAEALGVTNIMASSGGAISTEALQGAKDRGARRVALIMDNDEAGRKYTLTGIENAEALGLSTFVADLPEQYKDVDEYLKEHSGDELRKLIEGASSAALYQFDRIIGEYVALQEQQGGELSDIQTADLKAKVIDLAAKTEDSLDRARIINSYSERTGLEITRADLLEEIDRERLLDQATARNRELGDTIDKARKLQGEGKTQEAISFISETLTRIERGIDAEKASRYLENDIEDVFRSYRKETKGVLSHIQLTNGKDNYIVEFPSGAISVIGAPTNHGKSKLLQSVALDLIADMKETTAPGTVLYITYEEAKEAVIKQFLNAYIDDTITDDRGKGGNLQTLTEYLHKGTARYMRQGNGIPQKVERGIKEIKELFNRDLLKVVKPEDNYLGTLLSILRYATRARNIRAIFLDYAQEIYIERWKNPRTEELKEIMIEIDLIAQEANVPIIMGAQLKQETDSPLSLDNQTIADSKWICYKASEVVLFWSNKEKCKNDPDGSKLRKAGAELPNLTLGGSGQLYLKLTKTRLAPCTGLSAILRINGNSGRVKGNAAKAREQELPMDPDDNSPF